MSVNNSVNNEKCIVTDEKPVDPELVKFALCNNE